MFVTSTSSYHSGKLRSFHEDKNFFFDCRHHVPPILAWTVETVLPTFKWILSSVAVNQDFMEPTVKVGQVTQVKAICSAVKPVRHFLLHNFDNELEKSFSVEIINHHS